MTSATAIGMPGKERPAESRLVIQGPRATNPHQKDLGRNTICYARQPIRQTEEGLASPIPSELVPCHRPWIISQDATAAERPLPLRTTRPVENQAPQPTLRDGCNCTLRKG